jgi:RNA polymerase sigma-70 factor (ECF subfamily)
MGSELGKDELITLLNAKDKKAFSEVYGLYHRAIYLYAYKSVGSVHEAEDIAAESFIKLFNSTKPFESLGNVKAFLFIVTRNACLNYHKSANRKIELKENITDQGNEMEDPFHQVTAELIQIITKYIEHLPRKRKKIIQMILQQGLDDEQIANHLDIDPKTVRNQKNTAIQYLKQEISL